MIEVDGQYYDTWSEGNAPYEYKEVFAWSPQKSKVFDNLSYTFKYDTQF